jgi:hypothetical protein
MRWERAKNLMLLFFVILNIFLAVMLVQEQRRYTLSPEQEQAIRAMFTQHDISWYIHFIRQYPPMRPLAMSGFDYDMDILLAMLFDSPPQQAGDDTREIYEQGDTRLVISNGYISYDNPAGLGEKPPALTRENAIALGDAFIQDHYRLFVQDYVMPVPEGFRLFYREAYRGHIIHSNFIELLVTQNGITQIDMQYGNVLEYSGPAREICSPDEALLTFIQRVRTIWPDAPILISRMDLVYYQLEIRSRENTALHATPYYRIFIGDNEVPFMINAYTNVCIN